jgi:hypothetical protein
MVEEEWELARGWTVQVQIRVSRVGASPCSVSAALWWCPSTWAYPELRACGSYHLSGGPWLPTTFMVPLLLLPTTTLLMNRSPLQLCQYFCLLTVKSTSLGVMLVLFWVAYHASALIHFMLIFIIEHMVRLLPPLFKFWDGWLPFTPTALAGHTVLTSSGRCYEVY